MATAQRASIINDFLASMNIFSSAIHELMAEQLHDELGGELTIPQLKLLKLIAKTNTESLGEAAAFLGVSNAAASKAVDRLVRRDLVLRRESTDDRRATRLELTDHGRAVLERYETAQNRVLEGLFRQFMPEDFIETAELLDQLSCDIVDSEGGSGQLCFRCGIFFRDKCLLRSIAPRTCYCELRKRAKTNDGTVARTISKEGWATMRPAMKSEADRDVNFARWVKEIHGAEHVKECIQCGVCSGSCPLGMYMDYSPRRLIHIAKEGFREEVLGSHTIWLCTSCYACTVSCPREIKVTDIIYALKRRAIEEKVYPRRFPIAILAQEFGKMVRGKGRVSETWLVMNVFMRTNILKTFGMTKLGMNLMRTGRFSLKSESVKNRGQIEKLMKALETSKEGAA